MGKLFETLVKKNNVTNHYVTNLTIWALPPASKPGHPHGLIR